MPDDWKENNDCYGVYNGNEGSCYLIPGDGLRAAGYHSWKVCLIFRFACSKIWRAAACQHNVVGDENKKCMPCTTSLFENPSHLSSCVVAFVRHSNPNTMI